MVGFISAVCHLHTMYTIREQCSQREDCQESQEYSTRAHSSDDEGHHRILRSRISPCSSREQLVRRFATFVGSIIASTWQPGALQALAGEKHSANLRKAYNTYARAYDVIDGGPLADWLGIQAARASLLKHAEGKVLECAVGTGLNLPYYALQVGHVSSVVGIDISEGMLSVAAQRANRLGIKPELFTLRQMDVADLQLPSDSFDTVLDTFSLCVFHDPLRSLKEMRRVLKPDGKLLLMENSRSHYRMLGLYQDLTAAAVAHGGGKGCMYNQDVIALVRRAGLEIVQKYSLDAGLFTIIVARKSYNLQGPTASTLSNFLSSCCRQDLTIRSPIVSQASLQQS